MSIPTKKADPITGITTPVPPTEVRYDLTDDPWAVYLTFHDLAYPTPGNIGVEWCLSLDRISEVLQGGGPGPIHLVYASLIGDGLYLTLYDRLNRARTATFRLDREPLLRALTPALMNAGVARERFDWDKVLRRINEESI